MLFGFVQESDERRFPSPHEWSLRTRIAYRVAKSIENGGIDGSAPVNWTSVSENFTWIIKRLEDPLVEGQLLRPVLQDEGEIYVAGLGKAGFDISAKSEAWRRGYHTVLMGAAKAAENLDGWVKDRTRNHAFPPEVVTGPSNPRPKQVPFGEPPVPLEENCFPASEPAEKYYIRILTTHGFNSRQRLDAALAYADWLDFKGLTSTAEDMFDWGLDIAMGSLPEGVDNVVDIKTGIIDSKATYVSSNILLASTALGVHHARNTNLSAALPIFVSVLRARRELLRSKPRPEPQSKEQSESAPIKALSYLYSFLQSPTYPPPPPTGDELPYRTPVAICEEAAVMSHIGETLFASSTATSNTPSSTNSAPDITKAQLRGQESGLSWTREAVDLAEEALVSADKDDTDTRDTCSACLSVGMNNWSVMVKQMLKQEQQSAATNSEKTGSWLWGSGSESEAAPRWEREGRLVEDRFARVRQSLRQEADRKKNTGGFFT